LLIADFRLSIDGGAQAEDSAMSQFAFHSCFVVVRDLRVRCGSADRVGSTTIDPSNILKSTM
jgi:hypothetical protein